MNFGVRARLSGKYGMISMENYWKGKRVFVTGATGFLGSWIVKYLLDYGAHVTTLVRDKPANSNFYLMGLNTRVNVVDGDVKDHESITRTMNEYEIDTVIHLAAQALVGPALNLPIETFEVNVRGTWNVLEAARKSKNIQRVVVASSDKAYGSHEKLPYDEDAILNGRYPYDVSKSCADMIAQSYFITYGLPVGITRCGNLYGPGDMNFSRIVPGTFKSIIKNENPSIRSDGTFKRDYFFVHDAVNGYLTLTKALDNTNIRGHAFNLAPQRPLTVLELFQKMIDVSGKTQLKPIIKNEAKQEIRDQYLSNDKAKKLLGWSPKYTVEEGLRETYDWYVKFFKNEPIDRY